MTDHTLTHPTTSAALPARGVLYVATGQLFLLEAVESCRSLRQHHPDWFVSLMQADVDLQQVPPGLFDRLLEVPPTSVQHQSVLDAVPSAAMRTLVERKRGKLYADQIGHEQCLFIDSDTRICAPLDCLWNLLERFELGARMETGGYHTLDTGVPDCFPEYNSGLLLFRRSAAVSALFTDWRDTFFALAHKAAHAGSNTLADQPSLRIALYRSSVCLVALPADFNFQLHGLPAVFRTPPVLHGRPARELDKAEAAFARNIYPASYYQGVGLVAQRSRLRLSGVLRLWCSLSGAVLLEALKAVTGWYRWNARRLDKRG